MYNFFGEPLGDWYILSFRTFDYTLCDFRQWSYNKFPKWSVRELLVTLTEGARATFHWEILSACRELVLSPEGDKTTI